MSGEGGVWRVLEQIVMTNEISDMVTIDLSQVWKREKSLSSVEFELGIRHKQELIIRNQIKEKGKEISLLMILNVNASMIQNLAKKATPKLEQNPKMENSTLFFNGGWAVPETLVWFIH